MGAFFLFEENGAQIRFRACVLIFLREGEGKREGKMGEDGGSAGKIGERGKGMWRGEKGGRRERGKGGEEKEGGREKERVIRGGRWNRTDRSGGRRVLSEGEGSEVTRIDREGRGCCLKGREVETHG